MRQTFLYASTDCLRITPPPSHNLGWLFFRLFPHNSYHRERGHDLLNEGDILINSDEIAMTETLLKNDVFSAKFASAVCRNWFICSSAMLICATGAKNLELWPRPQNSVFKTEKNNGGEVGDWPAPDGRRWRGQPRCPPWLRYCISFWQSTHIVSMFTRFFEAKNFIVLSFVLNSDKRLFLLSFISFYF